MWYNTKNKLKGWFIYEKEWTNFNSRRECNVYSEVVPYDISIEKIKEKNPKGIIFTGGPASVYGEESPRCADGIFELGIPVLGICYGMQLMTYTLGGKVAKANKREYLYYSKVLEITMAF